MFLDRNRLMGLCILIYGPRKLLSLYWLYPSTTPTVGLCRPCRVTKSWLANLVYVYRRVKEE